MIYHIKDSQLYGQGRTFSSLEDAIEAARALALEHKRNFEIYTVHAHVRAQVHQVVDISVERL